MRNDDVEAHRSCEFHFPSATKADHNDTLTTPVTDLTRRMADDMKLRNFSQLTIDAYTYHVGRFAEFLGKSLEQASPEDVRSVRRRTAESSYRSVMIWSGSSNRPRAIPPSRVGGEMVPFGKPPKTLPEVLSGEEVSRLIECTTNIKHRTFLLTLYSAGLRLNEAAHLKIADIDSQRMQLRVACGKGAKERRVPLSPRLLSELREYWKQYRPSTYLFPGRTDNVPLAPTTIQKVIKTVTAKAGIEHNITPHTMRHSFATHLLEAGVDLLTISRLLGHKRFSTTMKYLHVRRLHLHSVPSPADWLPVRQLPGWAAPAAADASCRSEGETMKEPNNRTPPADVEPPEDNDRSSE